MALSGSAIPGGISAAYKVGATSDKSMKALMIVLLGVMMECPPGLISARAKITETSAEKYLKSSPATKGDAVKRSHQLTTNRRAVLAGSAAIAGLSIKTAAAADKLDVTDPKSVLRAAMKMRGALDGRLVFGALRAIRYTVVNAEVRPLMGLVTGTFTRYTMEKDGSVGVRSMELAFYTDAVTGELLDKLTMPYTGTVVEVPKLRLGPSTGVIRAQWEFKDERTTAPSTSASQQAMAPAGTSRTMNYLRAPVIRDGIISIQLDGFNRLQPADAKLPPVGYNEMVTYSAALKDVEDPKQVTVQSRTGFTDISTWRPWMKMDSVAGHTVSSGVGVKVFRIEDLPMDYLAIANRWYPDVIANPEKALAG